MKKLLKNLILDGWFLLLWLLTLITLGACSIYTVDHVLKEQMSSVVSVYSDGYCSGWVLKGSHQVVTAAHCAPEDVTTPVGVDFGDGVKHKFHVQYIGDTSYKKGPDLMTLTTNDDSIKWPIGFSVCKFTPYYGELITLMGGPLMEEKTITFGHVSNPSRDFTQDMKADFAKFIQYDGALLPGNSGGPAIDTGMKCVIGVADMIQTAAPLSGVPLGINYLTPASSLKDLVS